MRRILFFIPIFLSPLAVFGQISLSGTSYTENFDNIGTALPSGWAVFKDASATSLGTTPGTYVSAATSWSTTTNNFRNCASADGLLATSTTIDQSAATDRALAVRQTSSNGGDPGAAFIVQFANTSGKTNFNLALKLQSLDSAGAARTTTWVVDYGIGSSPTNFTAATTMPITLTTGGNTFKNTNVSINFGSALNNIGSNVWIRIVALSASSGSGSRATSGIDDFSLTWTNNTSGVFKPSLTAFTPTDESTMQPSNTGLTLTFDTQVVSGTLPLVVYNLTVGSVAATILPATMTFSGKTVTVPPFSLAKGCRYAVGFDSTSFVTSAGANCYGLYDTILWNFSTAPALDTLIALNESFGACNPSFFKVGSFNSKSISGAQNWVCSTFGHTDNASAKMNGYAGGVQTNEDWLISPAVNITNTGSLYLQFYSYRQFSGSNEAKVLVSSNYTGTGDPNLAIWTEVANIDTVNSPAATWQDFSNISLNAVANGYFYVAFKYKSTQGLNTNAFSWNIDDVKITTTPVLIRPSILSFSPTNGSTNVLLNPSLTITFDTTVSKGTGFIHLINKTTNTLQDISGNATNVSVNNNVVSVSGLSLNPSSSYRILIDSTAFNLNGISSYGLYDSTRWNFSTHAALDTLHSLTTSFENCTAITGQAGKFAIHSLTGAKKWACSYFGRTDSAAVYINGYSGGLQPNKDYLISPALQIPNAGNLYLHYYQKRRFAGNCEAKVMYSTNYTGYGDPSIATWTDLYTNNGTMDTVWSQNQNLNLSPVANSTFYIAFYYQLDTTIHTGAFEWTIDDISITETPLSIIKTSNPNLAIHILGNPVTNHLLSFESYSNSNSNAKIEISDVLGRTILSKDVKLQSGNQLHQINVEQILNGVYTVSIISNEYINSVKFIKQ